MTPASVISSFNGPGIFAGNHIFHTGSMVLQLNLFLNSRNKFDQNYWKKRHRTEAPKNKPELISAVAALEQARVMWNLIQDLLVPGSEPLVSHPSGRGGEGWAFPRRWFWQRWTLDFVFSCFLLSSNVSPEGEGCGAPDNSTVPDANRLNSLWSGTCCFGVCGGVVCLGFSSYGCLTCLAVKYYILILIYF